MPQWTQAQQGAIEARNCNLLVAAAAGSGKTAVLVERILQLILRDKADIDQMLIVTFTNAAAAEMRERIGAALARAAEAPSADGDHLLRQLNRLPRASISTLHSFCIGVLRRYFHLIDLDPGFRIGDETENAILKLEALEALLESAYEQGTPGFLELAERFGGNREDTPLQDLILKLHSFLKSKPDPEEWLKARIEELAGTGENLEALPWIAALKRQVRIELTGAISLTQEALELCARPGGPAAYTEALHSDLQQLTLLQDSLEAGLEAFRDQLLCHDSVKLKRCGQETDPDLKKRAQNCRNKAKDIINALQAEVFHRGIQAHFEDLREMHPAMAELGRLVLDFDQAYWVLKQEKGLLDFNDLEHLTLKVLAQEEAAQELRDQYAHIFVDEYQDSNIVQETILCKICRKDNLFMVGDVKQSIYRFRLADPSLFLEKYRTFEPLEGVQNRRIDLNQNFRSRPQILSGVNALFRQVMSEDFGEMAYDEAAALYPGLSPAPLEHPEVEVHLIDKEPAADADAEDLEDLTDMELEAHLAARRIQGLVGSRIYDEKRKRYRSLTYRDIVVLMRSTAAAAPIFQEVFASRGIPVYADINSGYFEALEVKTFIHLLRVIDNRNQDVPLLSVLRAPLGGFSTEDLITIRLNSSAKAYSDAVADYIRSGTDDLQQRLAAFYAKISEWQQAARYLPMEEFIQHLFQETGYYEYAGAMPGGRQRQANLRMLLERAARFRKTTIHGLFQFVRFIEKLQGSSGDMGTAKALGENEDVLRIMSIHKSKGLEFPVVLVAGLGRRFNLRDAQETCLIHKDLGLAPSYVNPDLRLRCDTLIRRVMSKVIRLESLSEEMRILYVAMTRARDKLILMGALQDTTKHANQWAQDINPYNLSKGRCPMDWIGPVLLRHPQGQPLRGLLSPSAAVPCFEADSWEGASEWQICLWDRRDLREQLPGGSGSSQDLRIRLQGLSIADPDLYSEISSRLAWRYPHAAAAQIPSKLTVTEAKRLREARDTGIEAAGFLGVLASADLRMRRPRFMEGTKQFTAAERGTLMHFVLQHLDYREAADLSQIADQVADMTARELLTPEEAAVVEQDKILAFLNSAVGRRIRAAERVYREVPFNYRKGADQVIPGLKQGGEQLLLQGVIDCCFLEGGAWVLLDYKTDQIYPGGPTPEETACRYQVQLQLYGEALAGITGIPVKERILFLLSTGQAFTL